MNIDDPRINKFNKWLVNITNTHLMISFWIMPWGWERPSFERYYDPPQDWRITFGPLQIEWMHD